MFYQIFFSPQLKRSAIISNKYGIFELPHKLQNYLRLRILGNQEISEKSQNFIELQPSVEHYTQNENFVNTTKKLMRTRVCFEYFNCCSLVKSATGSPDCPTLPPSAMAHRIFRTNSSFHVKWRTTGRVQLLFFRSFLLVLTKLSFRRGDWALGYHSMKCRPFLRS